MVRDPLEVPKLLLFHDITLGGRLDAGSAARRFGSRLDKITSWGFRFASLDEFVAGALGTRDAVVTFDDAHRSFLEVAWPELQRLSVPAALFACTGFTDRADAHGSFMTWDELRDCASAGLHVGCHAVSHWPLDEIPPDKMREEVTVATMRLREEGFTPTTFAYPFGRFDEATKSAVAEEGYSLAVTVMNGGADRLEVRRRLLTGSDSTAWLRLAMSDGFFETRDAVRRFVPRRFLRQENPIGLANSGPKGFGLADE